MLEDARRVTETTASSLSSHWRQFNIPPTHTHTHCYTLAHPVIRARVSHDCHMAVVMAVLFLSLSAQDGSCSDG